MITGDLLALTLYYYEIVTDLEEAETAGKHKEISVWCTNDETLNLTFQNKKYDLSATLGDALLKHLMGR